jgi:hypothetical protein
MLSYGVGLTDFYNHIHAENLTTLDIQELRLLRCSLNDVVLSAYGFTDIDPEYGFREVDYLPERDRIRFTISERARIEVLHRLADLNRQCHEEETLPTAQTGSQRQEATQRRRRAKNALPATSGDLFGGETP